MNEEEISDEEWSAMLNQNAEEYKQLVKTARIYCLSKIDEIKSGWYLWEAERHLPGGHIEHGTVQADYQGEGISEDSFEKDEE